MFEAMKINVSAYRARGAWGRGVKMYALEIIENIEGRAEYEGRTPANLEEANVWALGGANSWADHSRLGCALLFDGEIAKRLCGVGTLIRTRNGKRNLNGRETWHDVQTRALIQAWEIVKYAYIMTE